jgi:hypothetical protein
VVAVHGDSHYPRIDKPLLDADGRRVQNFTRVETFGDELSDPMRAATPSVPAGFTRSSHDGLERPPAFGAVIERVGFECQ